MKLHRYIDHDWQMTPIDFQVTSSPEHNVLMVSYCDGHLSIVRLRSMSDCDNYSSTCVITLCEIVLLRLNAKLITSP
ncbi:hypothetical protein DPMN_105379 [Dreissena polymorpha]|uniref:Uncharacterized protein n=1 Tax=Dreissena polymorpha TaxID=45954 RepID=A0A9D4K332_DREPO|nr:hypothetical protein DPMN_105379 [Dreissena polymorpha]